MAALPVTIKTAMVSPMALPMPNIAAAVIPDDAYGKITFQIVCQCDAPNAKLASFIACGVVRIASSETVMIR